MVAPLYKNYVGRKLFGEDGEDVEGRKCGIIDIVTEEDGSVELVRFNLLFSFNVHTYIHLYKNLMIIHTGVLPS